MVRLIALVFDLNTEQLDGKALNKGIVSSLLPSEVDSVLKSLKKQNLEVKIINGVNELIESREELVTRSAVVFNMARGFSGLDRKSPIPVICNTFNLPFTGSSPYSMALCRHKYHTLTILKSFGIRTPESQFIEHQQAVNYEKLKYRAIVKPNSEGGSLGITSNSLIDMATPKKDIEILVQNLIAEFNQPVILEEFISGAEYKVSVIENRGVFLTGCCEVLKDSRPMTDTIQSYEDVFKKRLSYSKIEDQSTTNSLRSLAIKVHQSLSLTDYSRIDFRKGSKGELYCMEVSTHPYLSERSSFIHALVNEGMHYDDIIYSIIDACINRSKIANQLKRKEC
ncbi:D-alanine--D-alanine ligase family protein [Pseudoalteromonas piscicida]|uniref:D-alanine--D-alanine ligase family protein n=1 Tax=Pseudoalteromonas piscicida TaxID=43662 RepID=UPI0030A30CFB